MIPDESPDRLSAPWYVRAVDLRDVMLAVGALLAVLGALWLSPALAVMLLGLVLFAVAWRLLQR